jgi:hypothetical protein
MLSGSTAVVYVIADVGVKIEIAPLDTPVPKNLLDVLVYTYLKPVVYAVPPDVAM